MVSARSRPLWKRIFLTTLKIYAGLCTLLVTTILVLILWGAAQRPSAEEQTAQRGASDQGVEMEPDWLDIRVSYDLPQPSPAPPSLFKSFNEADSVSETNSSQSGSRRD